MWQLSIVTFLDWWEIQFDQVWSSLIHFGQIWSKKIKNKTAIFILFKNVTTLYTNILWYMQPLKSSQTQTDADGNVHRHRSSNSSLDKKNEILACHCRHVNGGLDEVELSSRLGSSSLTEIEFITCFHESCINEIQIFLAKF